MALKIRIKRGVLIEAKVQEMAAIDVAGLIGQAEYDRIKAEDEHPLFIKLDVGKQGKSAGPTIIAGIRRLMTKIWSGTRIRELARWLNRKIPLFDGHNSDNSHVGRRAIGETLKGWTQEMKDGLHAFGVAYIPSSSPDIQKRVRDGEVDCCSIEADLRFTLGKIGKLFVDKIQELTGVALGSTSQGMKPGFATAGIIGVVQEMVEVEEVIEKALSEAGIDPESVEISTGRGSEKTKKRRVTVAEEVTMEDVQTYVNRMKVRPEALFPLPEILEVKGVTDAMDNEIAERVELIQAENKSEIEKLQGQIVSDGEKFQTDLVEKDNVLKEKDEAMKTQAEGYEKQIDELKPYKSQARQSKVAALVSANDSLKDAPQEQVDFIATHVTIPLDMDLESDDAKKSVDDAIKEQLKDIERHNITFAPKEVIDDPDESKSTSKSTPKPKHGDETPVNPFIPRKEK